MYRFFIFIALVFLYACATPDAKKPERAAEQKKETPYTLAKPKEEWVKERVTKSEERLQSSDAGKLILGAINYHGGLKKWFENGPVY
ncbi:MAG: hypothetical protein WBA74_03295, partial [Cyclobacteriaceae bacterium]